jgi:hypothetical protein
MEEDLREQVRKDVDKIWDEKLKESFKKEINNSFLQTLNGLKKELEDFNNSINNHIEELDKKFDEKWEQKFQNEMSQIEQLKNQNHDNDNNNNNNNDNNNNDDNDEDFKIIKNNRFDRFDSFDKNDDEDKDDNKDNKDEENDDNLRKKEIDFHELKNPPLITLTLLPNTNPLINIVLQCLSNIGYISVYCLNPVKEAKILQKSKNNPNNIYLGPSFLKLLDHLWKSNKKEYSPKEIHEVLKKLMLDNYNTNDASIIINYIINKLHEEINANEDNNNEEEDPFNFYNKEFMYNKYYDNFIKNKTQISEVFYSTIKKAKVCTRCQSEPEYTYESSPIINIYLEENLDDRFNKISFEEHFKSLLMNKDEQLIKEKCFVCDSSVQTKKVFIDIYSTTTEIIINIDRKKDPNNSIYFKYPEIFDGKKIINNKLNLPNYELTTVIKNVKNNMKYILYFKSFVNKKWYSFNNQKIELIQNDYEKDIFDEKNVCILIYSQKK